MTGAPFGIRVWLNRARQMRELVVFPENVSLMVHSTFGDSGKFCSFRV